MLKRVHMALAILMLIALAVVFFAPSVDLEPSALRAWRAAALIFFAIFVAAHVLLRFNGPQFRQCGFLEHRHPNSSSPSRLDLFDLHCGLLC
jgi:hypothetical protein